MHYSPDDIKALALHYGSYNKAAKALKIGKASLVDAANADIKGKRYKLSDKNIDKIYRAIKRLPDKEKKDLRQWNKFLGSISGSPNLKKAFMNIKQENRIKAKKGYLTKKQRYIEGMPWWEYMISHGSK